MAYVPGFHQDIFISYAQVDNEPFFYNGQEIRWVSNFKKNLQARVNQILGRRDSLKIWIDLEDFAGNQAVTPTINVAVDKTAVLVTVLSHGYINSEWCKDEVRRFAASAHANGRLFVVHLADIPLDDRPEVMRDLIGFNFFDKDRKAELNPLSDEYNDTFFKLREKLAQKLIDMKQTLERGEARENEAPAILLAEVTQDLDDAHDALATYVEKLGYRVLPTKRYRRGAQEYQEMLDQDLAQAQLFVQLLGKIGTSRTEDFPEGYEGLQFSRAKAANIPILRAYERDTLDVNSITNEAHRQFLEASDVMALDLEEFKVAIKEKLEELTLRESRSAAPDMGDKSVLIHALEDDLKSAFQVRDRLEARNLPYEILDENDPLEEVAKIEDFAGFVLVFGEQSSGRWITQRMKTFRSLRLAKQPEQPACALYFDPPEQRQQLRASPLPFFHTIDSSSGGPEFEQFINELRAMGGVS